ncbi:hypothetical protein F2P81_003136 [Scophthalmus maximus]|uniref:Uncharacterized protein n=1 Tax=Scophthalmus maximus TaxID=52904 RepID=A0A6A4THM4_SCOMX|nr:hypothetical protein F2P81_003136 [Scophthalmus maximus]
MRSDVVGAPGSNLRAMRALMNPEHRFRFNNPNWRDYKNGRTKYASSPGFTAIFTRPPLPLPSATTVVIIIIIIITIIINIPSSPPPALTL